MPFIFWFFIVVLIVVSALGLKDVFDIVVFIVAGVPITSCRNGNVNVKTVVPATCRWYTRLVVIGDGQSVVIIVLEGLPTIVIGDGQSVIIIVWDVLSTTTVIIGDGDAVIIVLEVLSAIVIGDGHVIVFFWCHRTGRRCHRRVGSDGDVWTECVFIFLWHIRSVVAVIGQFEAIVFISSSLWRFIDHHAVVIVLRDIIGATCT